MLSNPQKLITRKCINPRCRKQIGLTDIFCVHCGTNQIGWFLVAGVLLMLVPAICLFLFSISPIAERPSSTSKAPVANAVPTDTKTALPEAVQKTSTITATVVPIIKTKTPTKISSGLTKAASTSVMRTLIVKRTEAKKTDVAKRTVQASVTKKPSMTPINRCPGAPPQRLEINEDAKVCTKSDKVALREGPSKSYDIITMVHPGTVVWVIGGPKCGSGWSYWKVELPSKKVGWMSEGGDAVDGYFLCPN